MQIEPLSLSHQKLIENKFQLLQLSLSEYSFANLYLFRHLHRYQVLKCNGELFIKGITRDRVSFIMPTSHPETFTLQLLKSLQPHAEVLFPIPDTWLLFLEKLNLQASFKVEDSDYLFDSSKLAHFPGRHLSNKRNLVKQLFNSYNVKGEDFFKHSDDAQQVLDEWQKEQTTYRDETDYFSCQEAILHFESFHLHGRIIYIDQHPAGFTIGEWISKNCYVVHFSKALRSIKGLYQYLYQDLAKSIENTSLWINLEQDLGLSSIRDAKKSYLPDEMLRKWRIRLPSPIDPLTS